MEDTKNIKIFFTNGQSHNFDKNVFPECTRCIRINTSCRIKKISKKFKKWIE